MIHYQGRALRSEPPARRRRPRRIARIFHVLIAAGVVVGLAHLPWASLARRAFRVDHIRVEGTHYLDADRVGAIAGLHTGQSLLEIDGDRVRQALMLNPRIRNASVSREWPRGVCIRVVEREPLLLVRHGVPWEIDSSGVLLAPLADGVVADVPLLSGIRFDGLPPGAQLHVPEVMRGLAWARVLSDRELQLSGLVSEVDVASPRSTALLLMDGTRVLSSAWPPDVRTLSALRVVLADLKQRGTTAQEVDLRFQNQVIVRPAEPARAEAAHGGSPS
jgi:cell division septal protein FtsQ